MATYLFGDPTEGCHTVLCCMPLLSPRGIAAPLRALQSLKKFHFFLEVLSSGKLSSGSFIKLLYYIV